MSVEEKGRGARWDEADDGIGYGRPPKASRFKPGQSGNPKGRRKGQKSFQATLEAELNRRVQVTENGRQKTFTMREVIVKRLIEKAAKGDLKAIDKVIALRGQAGPLGQEAPSRQLSRKDQDLLTELLREAMEDKSSNEPAGEVGP